MKMGLGHSPSVVTSGLVLCLDAGNTKSYPGSGTAWTDLSGNGNTGTLTNGPTFNSYEARTNVVLYSADFTSGWTSSNVGMSTVAGTAPDGTSTAVKLYPTASTIQTRIYRSPGASTCISVFAKAAEKSIVYFYDLAGVNVCYFNLSTGSIGTNSTGLTASIINCGSGWFRCSLSSSSAFSYFQIGVSDANGSTSSTASGTNGIFIWGAQAEIGSFATSYIPTTSSAVTRSAGPATLVFDGVDDYATVSNDVSPGTGDFAVSVFVYKTDTVTNRYVWDFGSNGGTLSGGTSITPGFRYYNPTVGTVLGSAHTVNTWYNIVVSRISGITYFYSNGSLVNSAADTGNIGSWGTTLNIGRYGGGGYIHLGSISNLSVYKGRGLTDAEVLQNFNALRGRFGL